jgi:hypothetical protein
MHRSAAGTATTASLRPAGRAIAAASVAASNTSAITSPTVLSRFPMLRQVRAVGAGAASILPRAKPAIHGRSTVRGGLVFRAPEGEDDLDRR